MWRRVSGSWRPPSKASPMTQMETPTPMAFSGYKLDVSRGQRIGCVSSEWFNRSVDERSGVNEAAPALSRPLRQSRTPDADAAERRYTGALASSQSWSAHRQTIGGSFRQHRRHQPAVRLGPRKIAGNGTGETCWMVPGMLDWSTGIYNSNVGVLQDTTTLYATDRDVFI